MPEFKNIPIEQFTSEIIHNTIIVDRAKSVEVAGDYLRYGILPPNDLIDQLGLSLLGTEVLTGTISSLPGGGASRFALPIIDNQLDQYRVGRHRGGSYDIYMLVHGSEMNPYWPGEPSPNYTATYKASHLYLETGCGGADGNTAITLEQLAENATKIKLLARQRGISATVHPIIAYVGTRYPDAPIDSDSIWHYNVHDNTAITFQRFDLAVGPEGPTLHPSERFTPKQMSDFMASQLADHKRPLGVACLDARQGTTLPLEANYQDTENFARSWWKKQSSLYRALHSEPLPGWQSAGHTEPFAIFTSLESPESIRMALYMMTNNAFLVRHEPMHWIFQAAKIAPSRLGVINIPQSVLQSEYAPEIARGFSQLISNLDVFTYNNQVGGGESTELYVEHEGDLIKLDRPNGFEVYASAKDAPSLEGIRSYAQLPLIHRVGANPPIDRWPLGLGQRPVGRIIS